MVFIIFPYQYLVILAVAMAWVTRVFILYICVSVVTCHIFYGQHHHDSHHQINELPKIISSLIKQNFHNSFLQNHHGNHKPGLSGNGGYQFGIGNNGKPLGFSDLDFNFKPSDIFSGDIFGSHEFMGQGNEGSGNIGSQESGESSSKEGSFVQNPADFTGSVNPSGVLYDDSHIPNSGINIDIPSGPDEVSQGDSGGNLDTNNTENPTQENVTDGSTSEDINAGINENNGIVNVDNSNTGLAQGGELGDATKINGQGSLVPSTVGEDGNTSENKQDTHESIEKPEANVNINLNVPGDVLDSANTNVNVPNSLNIQNTDTEVGKIDSENSALDINKPEDQVNKSDLADGIEEQKQNHESVPFKSDDLKVEGEVHSNILDTNSKQTLIDPKESGLQLPKEDESKQDGKLKTNEIVELGDGGLDIAISKHRNKHSIIFPDKLNEVKEKIQKQKISTNDLGASQPPNLGDRNGNGNGQILYAINIAPAITSPNQESYVSPTTSANTGQPPNYVQQPNYANNVQNMPVSGQSGTPTPVQYVVQNPSNTGSNIVPNSNVVYSNPIGATSSGYTMMNVPNTGNNPGQVLYNVPAPYQADQSNGYYQVNNNQSPQAYYTVQLSNGQTALVPVSSGQTYSTGPSNVQGQVIVPSNNQPYMVSNSQPIQSNGQVLMPNNGQQYIPSNGNGQIFVSSNGQQYVLANSQPGQAQIVIPNNSQQYIQSNVQPATSPVLLSNGQNYVPNGQVSAPWSGQGTVQTSGQVYAPVNQNPQNNMVVVPSGSIVNAGGYSNSVPVMVLQGFKDKEVPLLSPSSSGEELDQSKDKINDDEESKKKEE